MTFNRLERKDDLPPLAWLLALDDDRASLTCGESVASCADAFLEGAWAGRFADWGFDSCRDVFGSGARRTPAGWLVVPPSHTLERIFLLRTGPRTWLGSNSLAFLFARTGARFVRPSRILAPAFIRIIDGLMESPITHETTAGTLFAVHHHNCLLTPSDLQLRPKPLPPRFPDYASYVTHLRSVLSEVALNAADPERNRPYPLLATISSGYDSPASAVIAREAGCVEALTFVAARGGAPDAGTEIAKRLDMSIRTFDRPATTRSLFEAELEFLATGMQAEDVVYAAAADVIAGRTLVTGFHGGRVWDRWAAPSDLLDSDDASGTGLAEFRLARDFIHIPVPFIGAQHHPDLARISNSDEMRPYSLNNTYDRPIPRRIGEEAGVPREAFGQSKNAVSLLGFLENDLLSEDLRQTIDTEVRQFSTVERFLYEARSRWFDLGMTCHELLPRGQNVLPAPIRPLYRRTSQRLLRAIFRHPFKILEHTDPFMGVAFEIALSRVSMRYRAVEDGHRSAEHTRTSAPAN